LIASTASQQPNAHRPTQFFAIGKTSALHFVDIVLDVTSHDMSVNVGDTKPRLIASHCGCYEHCNCPAQVQAADIRDRGRGIAWNLTASSSVA